MPTGRLKRTNILLVSTGAAFILGLFAFLLAHRAPDPRYHGKRLSRLLEEADATRLRMFGNPQQATLARAEALDALKELGPRAIPSFPSGFRRAT
jgi:hypothetical protein